METIKEIVTEYEQLHKQYEHLGVSNELPDNWADLTAEQIAHLADDAEWLVGVVQQFADKLGELYAATRAPYGYSENTVYSEAEYIAQGFTAEEAPKAREYDILWNKWINTQATPNEVARMEDIAVELGL